MFIAVVLREDDNTVSMRQEGDYSCFIGQDKHEAVQKAVAAAQRWSGPHRCDPLNPDVKKFVQYRVLVGELTEQANYLQYELVKVKGV